MTRRERCDDDYPNEAQTKSTGCYANINLEANLRTAMVDVYTRKGPRGRTYLDCVA